MNFFDIETSGDIGALIFGLIFVVFFVIVVSVASKAAKAEKEKQERERLEQQRKAQGRNPEYLSQLKNKLAERKTTFTEIKPSIDLSRNTFGDGDHDHYATDVETYDPIVGSTGEGVSGEGCAELNGIRLISNDGNYADGDGEEFTIEGEKLALTMILGEMLENPKFRAKK